MGDHRVGEERRIKRGQQRLGVTEYAVAVAAARHEIVGREAIDLALVERRVADPDRDDTVSGGTACIGLDGQARDLGKTSAGIGQLRKPVLEHAAQIGAADIDGDDAVVERQFGENIARRQRRAGRVDLAAADAAAIRHRGVGTGGRPHASATRLPMAASRVRTVAVRLSSATAVVPSAALSSLLSSPSYLATTAATSGSGVTVAVSMMRNCGHHVTLRRPFSSLTLMATSMAVT